ncbi:DMT family transporter [Streptomyces thermodiastaticus]|uniref:DMT family transporter n=1 Tax=Streptomyces thermodiastaticus TaxID=44061 RepID=UPI001672464C|nr:DMT family transporter [Streptomyces thermodiastaticus]MCE7549104.1 DMT family transporter [Streptomyces thermodiastaticus]GHF60163.1 membrane protein [Streptomyces thermodiastaticus]
MKPSHEASQAQGQPSLSHAHVYLLITMFFFGTAFTSSKVVVEQMPHQVAAAFRFGGGAVILLVILAITRRASGEHTPFSWREVVLAGSVGLVGVFGYNLFFFWGLSLAPSVDGTILVPVLSPVLTVTILLLTRQETASVSRLVGLALGLVGAAVFFVGADDGTGLSGSRLTGDFVYLIGSGCWAVYSIASKKLLGGMNHLRATTYGTCVGALALVLLAAPSASSVQWGDVSGSIWLNIAYLAVGPTAIAYIFYYRGLDSVSPSTATMLMFTVPVFGVSSSVLFLGESFTPVQDIGTAVLLVGAIFAVSGGRFLRRRQPAAAPAETTAADDRTAVSR